MQNNSALEILDVVNEKDEVVGQATKTECHADPKLIHRVVHFTIYDPANEAILIARRSYNKDHDAGKLTILGEHILKGENYDNGVIRGVQEELGFNPSGKSIFINKKFVAYNTQREIAHLYLIEWKGEKLNWDRNEMEEIMWVPIKELFTFGLKYSEMSEECLRAIDWESIQI